MNNKLIIELAKGNLENVDFANLAIDKFVELSKEEQLETIKILKLKLKEINTERTNHERRPKAMIQIEITNSGDLSMSLTKSINETIHTWEVIIHRTEDEDEGWIFIEEGKITIGDITE